MNTAQYVPRAKKALRTYGKSLRAPAPEKAELHEQIKQAIGIGLSKEDILHSLTKAYGKSIALGICKVYDSVEHFRGKPKKFFTSL